MEFGKPLSVSVTKINSHLIYKFIEHFLFMNQQIPALFSQIEEEWEKFNPFSVQLCKPSLRWKKLDKFVKSLALLQQDLVTAFDSEPEERPSAILLLLGGTIINPKVSCVLTFVYNESAPTSITTRVQDTQARYLLRQILPTTWPSMLSPTKLHLLLYTAGSRPPRSGWLPRQSYTCKPLRLLMTKQPSTKSPLFLLQLNETFPLGTERLPPEMLFKYLFDQNRVPSQDMMWFQRTAVIQGLKI
jgi:hypothetical protein